MAVVASTQSKVVVTIGSSCQRVVTLKNKNLVGATIKSEIREKKSGDKIGEWTIDVLAQDKFTMTIHSDVTEQFQKSGDYVSDIKVTFAGGFVKTYLPMQIIAVEGVTE